MKKTRIHQLRIIIIIAFIIIAVSFLSIFYLKNQEDPYALIPMVMFNNKLYYQGSDYSWYDEDNDSIEGYILSSVKATERPTQNSQSNFGDGYAYRHLSDITVEILLNNKWVFFEHGSGKGKMKYNEQYIDIGYISDDTYEWLKWYNGLSKEEQSQVTSIPQDLLDLLQ